MDRYTYNLKVEKIRKLVRSQEYAEAAKIADTLDWSQENNVRLLTAVADAYDNTGQYTAAIDTLLNAYQHAAIGKRIMYQLCVLALKAGQIDDAEIFYKKYLEEAPDENNRYILRYLIAEYKGEALDKRIMILETYKKFEFEEEWAYKLAELYQRAGREQDCVALCDEIILWFGIGTYVDKAMELKEMYQPLTASQRERRDNREFYEAKVQAVADEMAEAVAAKMPVPEAPEAEAAPMEENEFDDLPTIAISDEVAAAPIGDSKQIKLADAEPEPEEERPKQGLASEEEEVPKEEEASPEAAEDSPIPVVEPAADVVIPSHPDLIPAAETPDIIPVPAPFQEHPVESAKGLGDAVRAALLGGAAAFSKTVSKAEQTFAAKSIEDTKILEPDPEPVEAESPERTLEEPEEVETPEETLEEPEEVENPEETLEEPEEAETSEETSEEPEEVENPEEISEEPEEAAETSPSQEAEASEEEMVSEEADEVKTQENISIFPDQLDPEESAEEIIIAPEADELPLVQIAADPIAAPAIDAEDESIDMNYMKDEETYDENSLEKAVEAAFRGENSETDTADKMASTKNLKDILHRTIGHVGEDLMELAPTKEIVLPADIKRELQEEEVPAPKAPEAEVGLPEESAPEAEMPEEESIPAEEIPEQEISAPEQEEEQAESPEESEVSGQPENTEADLLKEEEPLDTPFDTETQEKTGNAGLENDANVLPVISYEETERAVWEDQNRRMTEAEPLESHEMEHCIFISAADADDGINKAVEALDDYYHAHDMEVGQIAKILGEKLNRRGLKKSMTQLGSKDLIIDRANGLNDDMIRELLDVMDHVDTEKMFVLLDEPEAVETLKGRVRAMILTPEHAETPVKRIIVEDLDFDDEDEMEESAEEKKEEAAEESKKDGKPVRKVKKLNFERIDKNQELTDRDFIRYADYYAHELECVIDDSGFEALEEELEDIRREDGALTAGEVEEIVEDAADHANKPTIKRMFASKYDKDGYLILRRRDFM